MVIPDSFAGVLFPPDNVENSETFLFNTWNMCHDDTLTPREQEKCLAGELLLSEVFAGTVRSHPETRFGMISSKADAVQIGFEKMLGLTGQRNLLGALMTPRQFYKWLNLMLQSYVVEPNFRAYLVDGNHHVYTSEQILFETTPLSFNGTVGGHPKLIDWIDSLDEAHCKGKRVVCLGRPQPVVKIQPPPPGTCYCDEALMHRV